MNKLEKKIIGILLGGACVWLCFVAFWWTAAVVYTHVGGTIRIVISAALSGLLIGIILNVLFLRKWVRNFYVARLWVLAVVYCAFCVLMLASFMGLPIGTFALGLLAGGYAGRRQRYNPSFGVSVHGLKKVAFFAATMTAGTALPIGFLALREQSTKALFYRILGISSWGAGIVVVCLLCIVLFGMQYWSSFSAGRFVLRFKISITQHVNAEN
jgi:hypothetical protein